MTQYFRFLSGNRGIYEAVEEDCPKEDFRRLVKPDGSWLPKAGADFPGAVSYWTREGLKKYLHSGLQDWHRRVIRRPLRVQVMAELPKPLYEDELQLICPPETASAPAGSTLSWSEFAALHAGSAGIVQKSVAYVTRTRAGRTELLVFDHDRKLKEAGTQVPAGTIRKDESPDAAVLRELQEESGLRGLRVLRKIEEYHLFRVPQCEFQLRHVFLIASQHVLPEEWQHTVKSDGEDHRQVFRHYWLPLDEAFRRLAGGFGDSIPKVRSSERDPR